MVLSDIEIANSVQMKPITDIAAELGLTEDDISLYGKYKGQKIDSNQLEQLKDKEDGKLILVTAISPTPAGEGKTTTSVGLVDALSAIGEKAVIALREPSLGPVFGIKGGAAGGGYAQVVPMEDINLHFTGDFHAIGIANNLLAALIDNHIHHGNELGIDSRRITWKRVVDMNDRQLRHIVDGFKEKQTGFLVKMALTSPWLLKSWPFSVSQKISLISKNALIASLSGTTTKDNRSQPKTSRLEVPWQLSSKMPSIQTWYKP